MGDQRAILAVKEGDLSTLEQLHIDGSLGQNITDSLGAGLVHHASRAGRLECLKFLVLQAKLPGNQRANNGATPAHDAAAMGNLAELQWLIKEGRYNKQEQDASGASPLHLAARFGHSEVVEWLVQAGYDTATETREGAVPAHYAAAKGDLTCLKVLVAADLSCVNKQTRSGATPLYLACQEGHLHIIQFLVKDCEANVHLSAHDGMTVLHAAACGGHYAAVIWLVTFTDLNLTTQDVEGATALHFAAREGHTAIADRLLLMGAKIVLDYWGGTPLHDAAENGHLECCQTLISHQIDPGIRDVDGYTARDLAEYNGHRQCACYLQEAEKTAIQRSGFRNQEAQEAKIKLRLSTETNKYHKTAVGQKCQQILSDDITALANGQTQQAMKPLHSNISLTSNMQKEVNSHLQKASTSKVFNMAKPADTNKLLTAEMKINKSLQKTRITTSFSNSSEKTELPNAVVSRSLLSMLDELGTSDIDALVPTHDERGSSIPEWKRQVMVRKLQAQLASEEGMGRKDKGSCALGMDDWQYSQVHNAILGPYGELLTEDDLLYLEKQIEQLQVKKKCQEYESELGCLTEELQAVFPVPIVNIAANSQFLQQDSEKNIHELPAWCSHVSSVVKNMSLLLTGISGMKKEDDKPVKTRSFSGGMAKKEILECGISVKDMRSIFEKQDITGQNKYFDHRELKTRSLQHGTGVESASPVLSGICKGKRQLVYEEPEIGDGENVSDSGISCEEASSEACCSHSSTAEANTLRKERIVLLFLSHWKKSAYTPSLKLIDRNTIDIQQSRKVGLIEVMTEVKKQQAPTQKLPMEISRLSHLVQQNYTIKNLISRWKNIIPLVPSRQIRRLNHQHTIYSPEQFLPYVSGEPVDYNSLTLDLFMLGYFHILELDLSPEERKARHLLCFEVFDHLGSHKWETVRAFHKAVMDEIAAGKRNWKDSLEDIKIQFFGNNRDHAKNMELKKSSAEIYLKPVSKLRIPHMVLQQEDRIPETYCELGNFSNDEICRYIDRSFAFWKEKEAEIFSFEGSDSLH
ncbi:LOW QUALITY PROTEIN: espin-like protein [Sceloporus undulatus]|uniref:LOW QUALITY PROTEIN: espin-like protein n=1 Tax=Sceloporus undulatus TaxID=8520 RepID=UPI001C4C2894|nr:LOW QUALITY PROTEIN: espin-like protein [Sceloporus undulatus]